MFLLVSGARVFLLVGGARVFLLVESAVGRFSGGLVDTFVWVERRRFGRVERFVWVESLLDCLVDMGLFVCWMEESRADLSNCGFG